MKNQQITRGRLNEFVNHYSGAKIYDHGSSTAYDALAEHADQELLESPEMWTALFDHNGVVYAIMGDGEVTSSGDYIAIEL
jgi:hypothetical protein